MAGSLLTVCPKQALVPHAVITTVPQDSILSSAITLLSYEDALARSLLTVLTTSVSIIFLVVVTLLTELRRESLDVYTRPLIRGTILMFGALLCSTLGLLFASSSVLYESGVMFTIAVLLCVSQIIILVGGISWLMFSVLGIEEIRDAF